jgi:hypothetical protein
MFHSIQKLSLIPIAIHNLNSIPIRSIVLPFPRITIPLITFPHPKSMPHTSHPLTIINLPVSPYISPSPLRLTVYKVTFVPVPIRKQLITSPELEIITPLAFIHSSVVIEHYSFTQTLGVYYLAIVYTLFVFL